VFIVHNNYIAFAVFTPKKTAQVDVHPATGLPENIHENQIQWFIIEKLLELQFWGITFF
jgi:hypothetical protein